VANGVRVIGRAPGRNQILPAALSELDPCGGWPSALWQHRPPVREDRPDAGAKLSANRSPFRKVLVGACVLEGRRAIRIVGQKQKVTVMPTFAAGTEELFMN
jgi:hypothetical protein